MHLKEDLDLGGGSAPVWAQFSSSKQATLSLYKLNDQHSPSQCDCRHYWVPLLSMLALMMPLSHLI